MMTRAVRLALLIFFTTTAVILTTLPGTTRLIDGITELWGNSDKVAAVLHCCLFALVTLVWFRLGILWLSPRSAVLLALGVALAIGTTTEALQIVIPARGATLLDLGANWLGIFAVAGCLLVRQRTPEHTT